MSKGSSRRPGQNFGDHMQAIIDNARREREEAARAAEQQADQPDSEGESHEPV